MRKFLKRLLRRSKIGFADNVYLKHRKADGSYAMLFQPNFIYNWLLKHTKISREIKSFFLGSWRQELELANLVPVVGLAGAAAGLVGSGSPAAFTYLAIGTGTTAANAADTKLEAEITTSGGARAAATVSVTTTDTAGDTAQLVKTFAFTNGGVFAVTEAGALNAASAGVLLNRQVFAAINVVSGDSLECTEKFDFDTA